jgi:hypothetical protein
MSMQMASFLRELYFQHNMYMAGNQEMKSSIIMCTRLYSPTKCPFRVAGQFKSDNRYGVSSLSCQLLNKRRYGRALSIGILLIE